jgi:hypothetical protein
MALEIQNGQAVLFGIANDGSKITISGYASFILQDGKLDHKFKMTAVEDENEADAALIATNEYVEATLTWIPSGANRAAVLATITTLPTPLQKITTTHFAVALLNGDWIYVGDASINLTHSTGKMSLKVRQYVNTAQNLSLVQTVSDSGW